MICSENPFAKQNDGPDQRLRHIVAASLDTYWIINFPLLRRLGVKKILLKCVVRLPERTLLFFSIHAALVVTICANRLLPIISSL
jgi:hypothetical protein